MTLLSTLDFVVNHPFNRGRPISSLARFAWWQAMSRMQREVLVEWIEGTKLAARNGMTGATGNIYCGLHEYEDMSFVLHALRPGDLFVDVGANVGSYTVLASGVCGAKTIAIEPDPDTCIHLERNIAANGLAGLVKLCPTAVGGESGEIAFTIGKDTMNRVASDVDRESRLLPLARLDDLVDGRDPTLIKMDVEGFESEVLSGARETLGKASLLAIELETVDSNALALLLDHGFQPMSYSPSQRRLVTGGQSSSSNALFVKDRAALVDRLSAAPRRNYRGRSI